MCYSMSFFYLLLFRPQARDDGHHMQSVLHSDKRNADRPTDRLTKIEGGPVPKSVHTSFKVLHTHVNDNDMPEIPYSSFKQSSRTDKSCLDVKSVSSVRLFVRGEHSM